MSTNPSQQNVPPYLYSAVHRSKQGWKLIVSFAVSLVGGGGMLWYSYQLPPCSTAAYALLTGILLAFGGILLGCLIVRCPSCGMRWMWQAAARKSYFAGSTHLMTLRSCPRCGWGEPADSTAASTSASKSSH